jgi:hypothetical protein
MPDAKSKVQVKKIRGAKKWFGVYSTNYSPE